MTKATIHLIGDVPVTARRSKTGSTLEIAGYASVEFPPGTEFTLVSDEAKPKDEAKARPKGSVTDDDHRETILTPDEHRKVLQAMFEGGNYPRAKDLEPFKDEPWTKVGPRPRAKKEREAWWTKWNKALGR